MSVYTNEAEEIQEIREHTKTLAKTINQVYNTVIVSCQRKCLSYESDQIKQAEKECLYKCANEYMFLDNFMYEVDSVTQHAFLENKAKKSSFFINRRIDDLTME